MGKKSVGRLVLWISDRHCVILAAQYGFNEGIPHKQNSDRLFSRRRRSGAGKTVDILHCADVLSGKRMGLRESAVAVQARGAAPGK